MLHSTLNLPESVEKPFVAILGG